MHLHVLQTFAFGRYLLEDITVRWAYWSNQNSGCDFHLKKGLSLYVKKYISTTNTYGYAFALQKNKKTFKILLFRRVNQYLYVRLRVSRGIMHIKKKNQKATKVLPAAFRSITLRVIHKPCWCERGSWGVGLEESFLKLTLLHIIKPYLVNI